jgi:Transposase DDE domain group 1
MAGALGLDFDRRLKLQFRGSAITSDAGLLAYRELDDVLALTTIGGERLADARTGKNSRHLLVGLLRQSVFGRLAGYEDVNDAERLRRDPAMRWVVGDRAITGSAASASQMGPLHESALSVRHLGRSMNGLRAGMSAPPLMAAARVAAGVTSLTCQEPMFTGPFPNRRSRPNCDIGRAGSGRPLPDPAADLGTLSVQGQNRAVLTRFRTQPTANRWARRQPLPC